MSAQLTDAELARDLANLHQDDLIWTSSNGWYQYPAEGVRWIHIPREVVLRIISDDLRGMFRTWTSTETDPQVISRMLPLMATRKAKSVLELLEGRLHQDEADFDADPYLLNTPSGVVDLRTGDVLSHAPDLLLTKITGIAYKKGASHPLWNRVLEAIPIDVLPWLQQRLGEAAIGTIAPKGLLIIFRGGGANGKTTFLGGCSDALGDYSVLVPDKVLLGNVGDHTTELTVLKGARLAMIEETAEARKLDVNRMKKLVETPELTARRMRQDPITWSATHSIFLSTNFRPVISETDDGTWRRLALVEFPHTFTESNFRDLTKAREVLEAALAWIVEGAVQSVDDPADLPEKVKDDTAAWREDTDLIMGFVRSDLEFDPDAITLTGDLFDVFKTRLAASNHRPWSDNLFAERFGSHPLVSKAGVMKRRTRDVSKLTRPLNKQGAPVGAQPWVWKGVRLKDDSDALLYDVGQAWKREDGEGLNWSVIIPAANDWDADDH